MNWPHVFEYYEYELSPQCVIELFQGLVVEMTREHPRVSQGGVSKSLGTDSTCLKLRESP